MTDRDPPPTMLILVRHAEPVASPGMPSRDWPLTEAGIEASARLCNGLPDGALLASSDELKAWMTLGGSPDVVRDPRFGEVRRPDEPWTDDFRSRRRNYVEGELLPGWEPREAVAARFDEAVLAHSTAAASRGLVIASHGMSITIWLISRRLVATEEAGPFWEGLRFPDALAVDLRASEWRRLSTSPRGDGRRAAGDPLP